MAWAWNDAIDQSFDWTDVATLGIFQAAVTEKWNASAAFGAGPYGTPAYAVGDDVQAIETVPFTKPITNWQLSIENNIIAAGISSGNGWLPAGFDPTTLPPVTYGDAGGLITIFDESSGIVITLDSILASLGYSGLDSGGKHHWQRQCPRTFASTTDTTDAEGNAIAAGQVAGISVAGTYGVYQFDGTSWQPTPPGTIPDVLSSEAAAPNHAVAGFMTFGDFIGPWIFKQIHDVLNAMTTFGSVMFSEAVVQPVTATYTRDAFGPGSSTWAAEQASVNTAWTTAATVLNVGPLGPWAGLSQTTGNLGGTTYTAAIDVQGNAWTVSGMPAIPVTAEAWAGPLLIDPTSTFDSTGYTGMTSTAFWKFYSTAGTITGFTTGEFPDPAIKPAWCPAPSSGTTVTEGFQTAGALFVFRWSFTYHA